ncbi:MAG: transglutaminase domain-containing protein [Chloroflexi bacterium]|nr:transglutaminase domain-containing protein [Chloroflexota bacterium]
MTARIASISSEEKSVSAGISVILLLVLILLTVTGSVANANYTENLGLLTFAAFGGLATGFVLARLRRIPGFLAHLLSTLLMIPFIATVATLLFPRELTYQEKLIVLWERIQVWTLQVISGGKSADALIFVIQLCLVTWLIAYWAGWFVYRQNNVWGAIIPTGVMLTINLFYAPPQSGLWFGLYVLCAMLLLIRLNLLSMERQWRHHAIAYASDISFDFLWYGALLTLFLLFAIWIVPASAPGPDWLSLPNQLRSSWQGFEDTFNRAFSSLRGAARPSSSAFFGTSLAMGGPINLGKNPVMDIQSSSGRYWRATIYDKYSGIGWLSTHLEALNVDANNSSIGEPHGLARIEITQTVRLYENNQNILYAQSQPERFNLATEVRYGRTSTGDWDVTLIRSRNALRNGSTYEATSLVSVADEDSLRADVTYYSEWISATYLQLPVELPQRVRTLAQQITQPYTNPYDQAAALESYARQKIKYNDQVSAPPTEVDGVDYTLFERPEGYCNYYASVMAVMARAVGIPARVVSGYTLGEYKDGVYHVVEEHAHSWVEIYFPTYGWIEFEPTANKPEIDRPKKLEIPPIDPNLENTASEMRRRPPRDEELENQPVGKMPYLDMGFNFAFLNDPRIIALLTGSVIGLIAIGGFLIASARRWQHKAHLSTAARLYENMLERATWLGVGVASYATPLELARAIAAALPATQPEAEYIAAAYTRERFSTRKLDPVENDALATMWSNWEKDWRRGMRIRIVESIAQPFRQMANDLQAIKRRIEHMQ